MKPLKHLKAESALTRSITDIINSSFGAVASVSSVVMYDNMKDAKVCLVTQKDFCEIEQLKFTIKSKIGKKVSLRFTPKLTFVIDSI